jgi:uncharacterized protein (TIGR03435 family)
MRTADLGGTVMFRLHLLMIVACVLLAAHAARAQSEPGKVKPSEPAPPLDLEELLQAPAGAKAEWESLKGKVVVLEFWATWCGPCLAAIPHLNDLADEFKDKPVQFIAVTYEGRDVIEPFLKRVNMRAWVGLDTNRSTWNAYGIRAIPHTVIVDARGRVNAVTYPRSLDSQALSNVLAGKPAGLKPAKGGFETVPVGETSRDVDSPPVLYQVVIRPASGERRPGHTGNSRLSSSGASLEHLIKRAYVHPDVATAAYGSPDWPNERIILPADSPDEHYDVEITIPGARYPELTAELRRALERTFGVRAQIEPRSAPVYILTKIEGHEAQLVRSDPEPGAPRHCDISAGSIHAHDVTIEEFAHYLGRCVGRDVVDETGIAGRYDFDLQWPPYSHEALIEAILVVEYVQKTPPE